MYGIMWANVCLFTSSQIFLSATSVSLWNVSYSSINSTISAEGLFSSHITCFVLFFFFLFLHIKRLGLTGYILKFKFYLMLIWTIFPGTEIEPCGFCDDQSCLTNLNLLEIEKGVDMGLTIAF